MTDERELKLIESAVGGSPSALDVLWRDNRRWIASVALAHKPVEADLDDVLQDVAASLVRHIGQLRDPSRFRPWLRTLARNAAISTGRRATVARRHLTPLDAHALERPDPSAGRVVDLVAARRETERTLEAMESIAPDQRECLMLRVQGLSQKAIAARLDVPVTTVESRLAKARRKLRETLEREGVVSIEKAR